MKTKIIVVVIFILCNINLLKAQFIIGFGVKGGLTSSDFSNQYSENFDLKTKFKAGFSTSIFSEFINNKYFNLIGETGYEQRGYTSVLTKTDEFGNYIGDGYIHNRTNYIYMGIGCKIKYKQKNITPYILIIPRIDFYLGYNVSQSELGLPVLFLEDYKDYVLEDFKKINFGVNYGVGMEFNNLLPIRTFIEASYSPDMITSFGNSFVKVKEHYFSFKLGVNLFKDKNKN